ncbi:hypothetical protein EW145_g1556 [Phellinidium pouzarii]|uniref:Uncharacterized protein n=1 Tax=Phellinidium pouzarii TaxID=167371 RepID=A0A4S4LE42_9AGAM|nr:hypothetical protein EW145_g1556 [Phellinidium pouzarii]
MQTKKFARQKRLADNLTWKQRMVRFGERLFGHSIGERALGSKMRGEMGPIILTEIDASKMDHLDRMREAEEARHDRNVDKLLDSYAKSRYSDSRRHEHTLSHDAFDERSGYFLPVSRPYAKSEPKSKSSRRHHRGDDVDLNSISDASMYTYLTGQPRRTADARQPVRAPPVPTARLAALGTHACDLDRRPSLHHERSRFSTSSYSASSYASSSRDRRQRESPDGAYIPTPAEEYALFVAERDRGHSPARYGASTDYDLVDLHGSHDEHEYRGAYDEYRLRPTHTGTSGESRNPFRR